MIKGAELFKILAAYAEQNLGALGCTVSPTTDLRRKDNRIVAEFFSHIAGTNLNDKESWLRECLQIGDAQYVKSDLSFREGAFDAARNGWLVSLTAFQAAKLLLLPNDFRRIELADKILACTQRFLLHTDCQREEVQVPCFDCKPLSAYFLPSRHARNLAPTVICICDERDVLLGQVLPATFEKDISLLLVEVSDLQGYSVSNLNDWKITSEMRFACCVDYLLSRHDVDAKRIAVYGDGFAAESATRFAICDRRVAAAVCDGGLWDSVRMRGAIEWIAGQEGHLSDETASVRRSRLARKIKCPFLVIANEQGVSSILEAIALQVECKEQGVGMDLHIPRAIQAPRGAIEGMISANEFIFDWLEFKLATVRGSYR